VEKNIRRNCPNLPFLLNETHKHLEDAIYDVFRNMKPVELTRKNLDIDYENILNTTRDLLAKKSITIRQQVIYDGQGYVLSVVVHHGISDQWIEERFPILANNNSLEFELSVKSLKIKSYIDLLGLDTIDIDNYLLPLDALAGSITTISYSDIKSFYDCIDCFYRAKKYRVKNSYPDDDRFALANAYDAVLKDEYDKCREANKVHPIMARAGVSAIPFDYKDIRLWQNSNYGQGGIRFYDASRNFILTGVIDEVLQQQTGKLIVVDFKTTSKEISSINDESVIPYRRQVSFYSYLLQKAGFPVHELGYLIMSKPVRPSYSLRDIMFSKPSSGEHFFDPYSDGINNNPYKQMLEFKSTLIEVPIDYSWIKDALNMISECLDSNKPPVKNSRIGKKCFNCSSYYTRKNYEDYLDKRQTGSI